MIKSDVYYRRIGWLLAILFSLVVWALVFFAVRGVVTANELNALKASPAPTVTETVTPKPKVIVKTLPPKVIVKTVRPTERASRSNVARGGSNLATSTGRDKTLACIRKHESGGNYRAVNSTGTYHGAYQLSSVYSPIWASRAGYGQWSSKPASQWPPAVQDAVAAHMGRNGWGAWSKFTSYDCPGF